MNVDNKQLTAKQLADEINEMFEDDSNNIVKIIQNPENNKQARVYTDDCTMMFWYDIEATIAEQMQLINNIEAEIIIAMEHENWKNENEWTTSRFQYYYLTYDEKLNEYWENERETYKEFVTLQYENIVKEQIQVPTPKPKNQIIENELEILKNEIELYKSFFEKEVRGSIGHAALLDELKENMQHWIVTIFVGFKTEFENGKMQQMDYECAEEVYNKCMERGHSVYAFEKMLKQLEEVYRVY